MVGTHAEHALALGLGGDGGVHLGVVRAGQGVPGGAEVALFVAALMPDELARVHHRPHRRRGVRRHQFHTRARADEPGQAALRDRAAADHHDAAAGELQAGEVVRVVHMPESKDAAAPRQPSVRRVTDSCSAWGTEAAPSHARS